MPVTSNPSPKRNHRNQKYTGPAGTMPSPLGSATYREITFGGLIETLGFAYNLLITKRFLELRDEAKLIFDKGKYFSERGTQRDVKAYIEIGDKVQSVANTIVRGIDAVLGEEKDPSLLKHAATLIIDAQKAAAVYIKPRVKLKP